MIERSPPSGGDYSPPIAIELTLHGERYNVAAIGGGRLRVRDARRAAPGVGVVRLTVDGRVTTSHIDLAEGIDPSRVHQSYELVGSAESKPVGSAA